MRIPKFVEKVFLVFIVQCLDTKYLYTKAFQSLRLSALLSIAVFYNVQKRFYNRETDSAAIFLIQQMSIKSPFSS